MSIERILAPLAGWLEGPPLSTNARIHSLVPEGPVWTVNNTGRLRRWPIYSTQVNLHSARKLETKPLTLGEILSPFDHRWQRLVVFDTSPAAPDKGNHWLIESWQEGTHEATLVFCDPTGGLVYDHINPFPPLLDRPPFFTGATLIPPRHLAPPESLYHSSRPLSDIFRHAGSQGAGPSCREKT